MNTENLSINLIIIEINKSAIIGLGLNFKYLPTVTDIFIL